MLMEVTIISLKEDQSVRICIILSLEVQADTLTEELLKLLAVNSE